MLRRFLGLFEPFVLALLLVVAFAAVVPVRGDLVLPVEMLADAGIVLLFFLQGAKLSRQAIIDGARNWRLHLSTLSVTYVVFPILGLAFAAFTPLPPSLAVGLLFLTLLPSTVQSSIAFTCIARGNVAAAVCSASFSNLLGIFLTPVLVALLLSKAGTGQQMPLSYGAVQTIALQLLLPFVLGHVLRPRIGAFVGRNKRMVTLVDRGSILLVVYTAFSAAVVEGLWTRVSIDSLIVLALACCVLLVAVLLFSHWLGKALGFAPEDSIVLLFCGSKKSLAAGVPIAGVLFPISQVGQMILPLMLFHQVQLIACAYIARRLAMREVRVVFSESQSQPASGEG